MSRRPGRTTAGMQEVEQRRSSCRERPLRSGSFCRLYQDSRPVLTL